MNTELTLFNGGINNLIEPHLIKDNEAQYVADCKIVSGAIETAKEKGIAVSEVYGGQHAIYYKAKDEVVASTEDRFYVEWSGFLYWSNSAGTLKRYDGTDENDIGNHTHPAQSPTVATNGSGFLDGDYVYTITYLHEGLFESAPADSVTISPARQAVKVSFNDTAPATATHRLVYRAGGLNPTFNLVEKVDISDTFYIDNTSDFNISRTELTTTLNEAPPTGLDMLVEVNGTFFGALGDKVYFSKEGQPEYWSNYQYVQFPTTIEGLGVVGGVVIAFTDEEMYMISGTNIANIQRTKLPFEYGCKHKRTVRNIKGVLVWMSAMDEYDVICAYAGADVQILNITNTKMNYVEIGSKTYADFTTETYDNFTYETTNAIVSDRRYYLFLTGRTVVVDFEFEPKTYYLTDNILGAYTRDNQLYVIEGTDVYNYLDAPTANYRNLEFVTREYTDGKITREKTYRKIHIDGEGSWSIDVLVDNVKIHTLSGSDSMWGYLPSGAHGRRISFRVTSSGLVKIRGISYEYELKKV